LYNIKAKIVEVSWDNPPEYISIKYEVSIDGKKATEIVDYKISNPMEELEGFVKDSIMKTIRTKINEAKELEKLNRVKKMLEGKVYNKEELLINDL